MDDFLGGLGKGVVGIISGIIGVAIIAVVLANGSQTPQVIATFFQGLTGLLGVVVQPVTGGSNFLTGVNSATGGLSVYAGEVQPGLLPGAYGYSYFNPAGATPSGYGGNSALNTANQAIGTANTAINTAATVASVAGDFG